MKRLALPLLVLCLASAAFADEPEKTNEKPGPPLGARADKLIKEALPVCSAATTESRVALQHALPADMIGVIRIDSKQSSCQGQWVAITSTEGDFLFGTPWFLDGQTGTLEERLKSFTTEYMKDAFNPAIDRTTKTREGLYHTTLYQTVEGGKLPLEGKIDPAGTVFFIGHFVPIVTDYRASRVKAFEHFLNLSPSTGAAKPEVTVIEFSDFECPSCQRASGWMKPILEAHGDISNDVRATPTYIVNGAFVEAGSDGKGLSEYINAALKKVTP
jgi:hypothetical protein